MFLFFTVSVKAVHVPLFSQELSIVFCNVSIDSSDDAVVQLVTLAMKLFNKMVDSSAPFHLTLINVCFSNLQTRGAAVSGKGSITSFFTNSTSPRKTQLFPSQIQVAE